MRKRTNALETGGEEIQNYVLRGHGDGRVDMQEGKLFILIKVLTVFFFPTAPLKPHVRLASASLFYKW